MTFYVLHPHHNGVVQVEAGSPQEAARVAVERDKQEGIWGEEARLAAQVDKGVELTVSWGDVDAHGSASVTVSG